MDGIGNCLNNRNMPVASRNQLPAYALYGDDASATALADRLHVESIAERSRLHDWEIRPHRHDSAFQLLLVLRGHAEASLDGAGVALEGPAAVTVPVRFDREIEVDVAGGEGSYVLVAAYGDAPLEPVHRDRVPFGVTNPIFLHR